MERIKFCAVIDDAEEIRPLIEWFNGVYKMNFVIVEVQQAEMDLVFIECNSTDLDNIFLLGFMYGRTVQKRVSSQQE